MNTFAVAALDWNSILTSNNIKSSFNKINCLNNDGQIDENEFKRAVQEAGLDSGTEQQ